MSEKFNQRDRVKLSQTWLENNPADKDLRGTISGRPHHNRYKHSRVKWDIKNNKENYHNSFLELA